METKQISFEQTNIELLNHKELIEIVGGSTSFAYDAGTLLRIVFQTLGHDYGGVIATESVWYAYQ